ncbi:MAG: adenine deaminase C-terminal domain-containing protein, partial [Thermoplasmata archaeon]
RPAAEKLAFQKDHVVVRGAADGASMMGKRADIVRVSDLRDFRVEEVYIGGQVVAAGGAPKFETKPKEMVNQFVLQRKVPSDFEMSAPGDSVTVKVIGVVRDEIVTKSLVARLRVEDGKVRPSVDNDILRVAVVNRYRDAPVSNGFVKGFGLKSGAIASSVAHDSHNILVVGVDPESMAVAVNTVVSEGGGYCVCADGRCSMLNLRVAGLMCTKPARDVKRVLDQLHEQVRTMGCPLDSPFMTMSFLSLLVIPELKIGDRGLFDVSAFKFVDVVEPGP